MKTLQAKVVGGRFVIDTPSPFPDGTVVSLVIADDGDELDAEEQAALDAALAKSWESVKAGRLISGEEVFKRLDKK